MPKTGHVRQPTQERALRTRKALVAAGTRQFARLGYAGTTAAKIAKSAGVATGSFYQYFPSKDALLHEVALERQEDVARRTIAAIEAVVGPGVPDAKAIASAVRSIVREVLATHQSDPGLHAVLTERRHADPALDRVVSDGEADLVGRISALLVRWRHPGDRDATAFVLFGLIEGAVHAHVLGHALVTDARLVDALVDAVLRVALPGTSVSSPGGPDVPRPSR